MKSDSVSTRVTIFNTIRNIPYKLRTSADDVDASCVTKHEQLNTLLANEGYAVRNRIALYEWEKLPIPKNILVLPHTKTWAHQYSEIFLDSEWTTIDATWDLKLKEVFTINYWDGVTSTSLAVDPKFILSPEESEKWITTTISEENINGSISSHYDFVIAFNEWLASIRKKSALKF
jgi:hypothetical protein